MVIHVDSLFNELPLGFLGLATGNASDVFVIGDIHDKAIIDLVPLDIPPLEPFVVCLQMTVDHRHPDTPQLERDANCSFVADHIAEAQSHFLIFDVGQKWSEAFSNYHYEMRSGETY